MPGGFNAFNPAAAGWQQLGAMPDTQVRFQYQVLAGNPGVATGVPNYPPTDFWFVSHALGDLDGRNGVMALEGYAPTARIYVSTGIGGPPLSRGWE